MNAHVPGGGAGASRGTVGIWGCAENSRLGSAWAQAQLGAQETVELKGVEQQNMPIYLGDHDLLLIYYTPIKKKICYGDHWLILLMSIQGILYCHTQLLQLKQDSVGPPEWLGKSAVRIPPVGTPCINPSCARPGNTV